MTHASKRWSLVSSRWCRPLLRDRVSQMSFGQRTWLHDHWFQTEQPKEWPPIKRNYGNSYSVNVPGWFSHALLSNSFNAEAAVKKNGSQNQVALVSGVSTEKQHNEVQVTLPKFPQETAAEWKYAYDSVTLKADRSLHHNDLFSIVVLVYQILPQTKATRSGPE